jgi:hypothetical protein
VIRQRLDLPGRRQINKLGAHRLSDLLPCVDVDLAQLAKGSGLPADRVRRPSISE